MTTNPAPTPEQPFNPTDDPRVSAEHLTPTTFWRIGRLFCRLATTLAFDEKIYGAHNVPATGGVLLAANHQSYLDPVLVSNKLIRPVSFLAKSELFVHPLFSKLIIALHAFPVRQGAGDVGAVKETIRRLREGHVLNVYPEGTRTPDGQIKAIEPGIALIIRRAGVPVIPVGIAGSYQAWPSGQKFPRPHPIRVVYGPPLHISDWPARKIVAEIDAQLHNVFAQAQSKLPPRPH